MGTPRTIDDTPRPPAKLAHFVVSCRHFEETVAWYKTVMVAQAAYENEMIAFMTWDEEHHRVALVNIGEGAPENAHGGGLDHIGFTLGSVSALMSHYHRLKAENIVPAWCVHHGGTLSMYYDDPEGVRCEFQIELFDDPAVVTRMMQSPEFAANPIGIVFDPEILIQRYLDGETDEQILDQSRLPQ